MQFFPKDLPLKSLSLLFLTLLVLPPTVFSQRDDKSLRLQTIKNIKNDDVRGEDLRIRRAAITALGNRAGTVVVMSPQSGRIFTIVNQNWAIRRGFKPCSTIKLVTGVAGYQEKLITPKGVLSKGSYRLGLNDSLAYSNNRFFQKVGASLGTDKMISYSKRLGLGERTGINADGEYAGRLPYGNKNLRIYSHADDFLVTPLQLAVMVSAVSNGGDLVIPQIPRSRISKTSFRGYYRRGINLRPSVFERVIPGMIGAVKYGTARRINDPHLRIAGKTGSCISNKTWVGLFASVAPINDPRFSVVVILEGKYARGKYSAAIAGKIYQSLKGRFNERYRGTLARRSTSRRDNRQLTARLKNKKTIINAPVASNRPSKRVIRTNQSSSIRTAYNPKKSAGKPKVIKTSAKKAAKKKPKNLFPTVVIKGKAEITRPRVVKN